MKVLFIGPLNINHHPVGGDQYKNQLLAEYFVSRKFQCTYIDTNKWQSKPFLIVHLIYCVLIKRYDRIVLSVSAGSAYRFIRFLNLFPQKLNNTVYLVIGGDLTSSLSNGMYQKKYYTGLKSIAVEGEMLKHELKLLGLENVETVPNFKRMPSHVFGYGKSYDLCNFVFISRITPSKGVELIFEAVKLLNLYGYSDRFSVTFYGPLDPEFKPTFTARLDHQLKYGGVLNLMDAPADMYEKLAGYNCMLFPTYWFGEGFPGVIIDAFIASLPVIASDWNMNTELIQEGINGFIVRPNDPVSLASSMKNAIDNPDLLKKMSDNASKRAKDYDVEKIGRQIIQIIS